jgi:hypothetical protein
MVPIFSKPRELNRPQTGVTALHNPTYYYMKPGLLARSKECPQQLLAGPSVTTVPADIDGGPSGLNPFRHYEWHAERMLLKPLNLLRRHLRLGIKCGRNN